MRRCFVTVLQLTLILGLMTAPIFAASEAQVNPSSPPVTDQHNPCVTWDEINIGDLFAVYTDFPGPPSINPSFVFYSYSTSGATWTDQIKPVDPGFIFEWNAWVSAVPGPVGGYAFVSAERDGPAYQPLALSAIDMNHALSGAAGFGGGTVVRFGNIGPNGTWVDFPVVEVDDDPAGPNVGDANMVWVEFLDANGDADQNGNWYDDPGDRVAYFSAATSHIGFNAPPYPGATPPIPIFAGFNVKPNSPGSHRIDLDILSTPGNALLGPGAAYVAFLDYTGGMIRIDANPNLGGGGAWGFLTGGGGPYMVMPFTPGPSVIVPGMAVSQTISIACDSWICPGSIYLVWADYASGTDYDIFFAQSPDGGLTWFGPTRINQDPVGNGRDQWAPHIRINEGAPMIVVTYYDRRNDAANVGLTEVWRAESPDCGITWIETAESQVGPVPTTNTTFLGGIGWYLGDYLANDWSLTNSMPSHIWTDGRNGADQDVIFNCCRGIRGNVNCDPNDQINVSDLTYLIGILFTGGPPPCCWEEADINGDGTYNITDVVYFVAFLFSGGPPPPPC